MLCNAKLNGKKTFLDDVSEKLGFLVGVKRMFLSIAEQPLAANRPAETVVGGVEIGIGGQHDADEVHAVVAHLAKELAEFLGPFSFGTGRLIGKTDLPAQIAEPAGAASAVLRVARFAKPALSPPARLNDCFKKRRRLDGCRVDMRRSPDSDTPCSRGWPCCEGGFRGSGGLSIHCRASSAHQPQSTVVRGAHRTIYWQTASRVGMLARIRGGCTFSP